MDVIEEVTQVEYTVGVVNSIAKRYKELRQESKAPTFLL
jgi:hypothetical protein